MSRLTATQAKLRLCVILLTRQYDPHHTVIHFRLSPCFYPHREGGEPMNKARGRLWLSVILIQQLGLTRTNLAYKNSHKTLQNDLMKRLY